MNYPKAQEFIEKLTLAEKLTLVVVYDVTYLKPEQARDMFEQAQRVFDNVRPVYFRTEHLQALEDYLGNNPDVTRSEVLRHFLELI